MSIHYVERNDWPTGQNGDRAESELWFRQAMLETRAAKGATARFVNPNADCPVCGDPVFFYQNERGSRVYFDEVGPPWPKHPCTDNEAFRHAPMIPSPDAITPTQRAFDQVRLIETYYKWGGVDPDVAFFHKYGTSQWDAWRIDGRFRVNRDVLLVLSSADTAATRRRFIAYGRLPKLLSPGFLVFTYCNWLAYFDPEAMQEVAIETRRIKSASAFVDELVTSKHAE